MTIERSNKLSLDLSDKTALITGGLGGIGFGIAADMATCGAQLIIHDLLQAEMAAQKLESLRKLGAKNVHYYAANLANPSEISDMFNKIQNAGMYVDILINNAGVQCVSCIEEFPDDKFEQIIRVDLLSSFYTIKQTIAHMKQQKWGRIVNVASAHGLVASPYKSAYVAAKHGLIGMTKSVALECAEHGVSVNAICPGYVKTDLVVKQIADTAKCRNCSETQVMDEIILGSHANKRFIEVSEIAQLVLFLVSEGAMSITGSAITIDGGWTAR
ncbi:putative 3-hydroxybutyrate short chain dehydrogenase [Rickettsiales endosymbiont of Paramecium tredecaurelia]|uniref:3-hydroxybutyrate dehydrogenase n=1 Tax=Candidatus Sarmatiella mevalonica TaxID=2770581 RepID=UPI0019214843|nr:3-hydroxybutyrate dehydrogenase [Candidatus Sarmatiella mevalonica]MBL3284302.1 putative 3-hydroxybutyrate short chain dehydrogenase [Candidatus Sarmatiella mevalonica]